MLSGKLSARLAPFWKRHEFPKAEVTFGITVDTEKARALL